MGAELLSLMISKENGIVIHSLMLELLQRAHSLCLPNALESTRTLRLDPGSATEICVTGATMLFEVHGFFGS